MNRFQLLHQRPLESDENSKFIWGAKIELEQKNISSLKLSSSSSCYS